MGGGSSINYMVPVTAKTPGESPVYRYPEFKDKLYAYLDPNLTTMKALFINSYKKYANNPALGIALPIQAVLSKMRREKLQLSTSTTRRQLIVHIRLEAPLFPRGYSACQKGKRCA